MAERRKGVREETPLGIEIRKSGSKPWQRDYREADVRSVFSRADWRSWEEVLQWLEQNGDCDNELTPGEIAAMKEDMRHLQENRADFTTDPSRVFQMMHRFRK